MHPISIDQMCSAGSAKVRMSNRNSCNNTQMSIFWGKISQMNECWWVLCFYNAVVMETTPTWRMAVCFFFLMEHSPVWSVTVRDRTKRPTSFHLGSNWNVIFFVLIGTHTYSKSAFTFSNNYFFASASTCGEVKGMKAGGKAQGCRYWEWYFWGSLSFEDWPAVITFIKRLDWLFEEINMLYRLHAVVNLGGSGIFATLS